jgi:hypothetical protein
LRLVVALVVFRLLRDGHLLFKDPHLDILFEQIAVGLGVLCDNLGDGGAPGSCQSFGSSVMTWSRLSEWVAAHVPVARADNGDLVLLLIYAESCHGA